MKGISFLLLLCACSILEGCITADAVYLKDANGQTAQCGPYKKLANIPMENEATEMKMRSCVSTFERQGYEKVATPG